MVPAAPPPDLVIPQPRIPFAPPQGALDPMALPSHERQPGGRRGGRGVAETVLDLGRGLRFPADDRMPMPRPGCVAIPQPDPPMEDVHLQAAFGAQAQGQPPPGLGGLLGGPTVDPDRRGLGDASSKAKSCLRRKSRCVAGIPAARPRFGSRVHASGGKSRASSGVASVPQPSAANTPTRQCSTLPGRPHRCRPTPTECRPCFGNPLSSTIKLLSA